VYFHNIFVFATVEEACCSAERYETVRENERVDKFAILAIIRTTRFEFDADDFRRLRLFYTTRETRK